MSESVSTLQFTMSREQIRELMRRYEAGLSHRVYIGMHYVFGIVMILASYSWLQSRQYWNAAFFLLGGIFLATGHHFLMSWVIKQLPEEITATLEYDDRSLLLRSEGQKFGNRFWWSRLTSYTEDDWGLHLCFDGSRDAGLWIPTDAFGDQPQHSQFLERLARHCRS